MSPSRLKWSPLSIKKCTIGSAPRPGTRKDRVLGETTLYASNKRRRGSPVARRSSRLVYHFRLPFGSWPSAAGLLPKETPQKRCRERQAQVYETMPVCTGIVDYLQKRLKVIGARTASQYPGSQPE